MRGGSRLVAVAGLVAIGSLLPSANATSGRHCAIQLNPISRHGSVIEARGTVVGCYPTFAQALAAGSRGTITVDASMTPDLLGDDDLPPVSPTSSVLIGTEYNALGFGGSSNDYFASTACAGTDVWEVNYVGDAERPVLFREGVRRMRPQQEVPGCRLRRQRLDVHAELQRLRVALERGVVAPVEAVR